MSWRKGLNGFPAVYAVTLNAQTKTAHASPVINDTDPITWANTEFAGEVFSGWDMTSTDSSEVVPSTAPRFGGAFMFNSLDENALIFDAGSKLFSMTLTYAVDDSAWATTTTGALYVTDPAADTVDTVSGQFTVGTMFSSVTPCASSSAPATCPAPGYPANYLATTDMGTGALSPLPTKGPALHPEGMIFAP